MSIVKIRYWLKVMTLESFALGLNSVSAILLVWSGIASVFSSVKMQKRIPFPKCLFSFLHLSSSPTPTSIVSSSLLRSILWEGDACRPYYQGFHTSWLASICCQREAPVEIRGWRKREVGCLFLALILLWAIFYAIAESLGYCSADGPGFIFPNLALSYHPHLSCLEA